MRKQLYYITCVTNLHVGSGDINYNIVDKEVEKDPVTGLPTIHASGIKGALRDDFRQSDKADRAQESWIFGDAGNNEKEDSTGAYHFLNAQFISRPMRVKGFGSSIAVTTVDAINDFVSTVQSFGLSSPVEPVSDEEIVFPQDTPFLASVSNVNVEGEKTELLPKAVIEKLKPLLGDRFAIAASLDEYDLPVIARNNLQTKNGNLWYEEYVPHGSRFYCIVLSPEEKDAGNHPAYALPELVQFGGNASIGYGYCKIEKAEG